MPIKKPSLKELAQLAQEYHFNLSDEDLASFQALAQGTIASCNRLDELSAPSLPTKYPRQPGYRPQPNDNPYNAWYWKTSIKGADGKLTGKAIAIKDNVCVAGVPMMDGTAVLEGYIPEGDATIVTRILDEGGEIAGKAVCESLCFSGSSFTSDTGPVRNPHDESRSAGGSSSGSAALVAGGIVDMAIGGDQGGSIRIPACWCGIVGLKPTYGLVPYTGIFPIELTLDHTGPMARTVADTALLLEAIAGPDGLDPRQYSVQVADSYTAALTGEAEGLRVGIIKEGFGWAGLSEPDVDEIVMAAAYRLEKTGCKVSEVSIPMHRDGIHIWRPIATEGATMLMIKGNSMGTNWKGHYTTSLLDVFASGWHSRADDLSETVKATVLTGQYMQNKYHGRYYAKAQNLGRVLRNAYDTALQEYDVLVMPTLPLKATKLPAVDASREEYVTRALEMIPNTAPFDVTGHPAISINAGISGGLPVGMMVIGRYWDEPTVLRVAHAFEQLG